MKIKLKDLTIGQIHTLCVQVGCENCPLNFGGDYENGYKCTINYTNLYNTEVDISDEILEETKNEN